MIIFYNIPKKIYRSIKYFKKYFVCSYLFYFQKHTIRDIVFQDIKYELFITHDFDGGTLLYEQSYIRKSDNILVLRNISHGKDILFSIENPLLEKKVYIKPDALPAFLKLQIFSLITVNSFVKNLSFESVINSIGDIYKKDNTFIRYNVHDFHCICPNYTLINHNKFCNIECSRQTCIFDSLFVKKNITLEKWRKIWGYFLSFTSEVVCFSQSSKELIVKVYPNVCERIKIMPHSMSYCKFSPVNITGLNFHVGIIGNITSQAKGLSVVRDFLKYASKNNIRISVIGKMRFWNRVYFSNITYFGSYKNEELQLIIEREQISIVLFPSICPETFSYLISELMVMNMPIFCFDIGAQAEKVKRYAKGYVCQSTDPKDILFFLKKQYNDLKK